MSSVGSVGIMLWYARGEVRKRCGWIRTGPRMDVLRLLLEQGTYKVFGTGVWKDIALWRNNVFCWDGIIHWRAYLREEAGYTTFEDYESE